MSVPVAVPVQPRELGFDLDVTFAEHVRALRVAQRRGFARGRQLRRTRWTAAVAGTGVLLWMQYAADGAVTAADWVTAALFAGLCLSPAALMLDVLLLRRLARGPRRVTLSDAGIRVEDPRGAAHLPWGAVREVREEAGLLLLDAGANGLFPIPLRVLRRAELLDPARILVARVRGAPADARGAEAAAAPHPGIVVAFTPTMWEGCKAVQHTWFRSRMGRLATASLFAIPIAGLALLWWVGGPAAVRANVHLLGGAALGLALAFAAALLAMARTGMVPVRATLDAAGITYDVDDVRTTTAWTAVRRVQRAGGLLLVWADRSVPSWLPLRALGASADDVHRFIREQAGTRAAG